MSNLVIVAIPGKDDPVWKVSTEKVPHLTLLFLGEQIDDDDDDLGEDVQRVVDFVEHAVTVSEHGPFHMNVDYRDTLGPDNADVLFFQKGWSFKWINQFRNQLLQQPDIREFYDAADQYDEWTPHLTLGYPAAPAKDDAVEYPISWVSFDRIAVWTGDYEGPEFRLQWPERDSDLTVAYSDTAELGEQFLLEHHGVKGMRWGVRKEQAKSGAKAAGRAIATGAKRVGHALKVAHANLADSAWHASTYNDATHETVHNLAAGHIDANLHALQRSPKYAGKNLKTDSDLRKQYYQDVAKATDAAYEHATKTVYGQNYTHTRTAHYVNDVRGPRIEVRDKSGTTLTEAPFMTRAQFNQRSADRQLSRVLQPVERKSRVLHAATTEKKHKKPPKLTIPMLLHSQGHISGVAFVSNALDPEDVRDGGVDEATENDSAIAQSMSIGEQFVLEHYGVLGMKWGRRKAEGGDPTPVTPQAFSRVPRGAKRKTKIDTTGGENHPAHEDAVKVARAQAKLKKSGAAALSNQELRDVATRVQLEQQVSMLTGHRGKQWVNRQLRTEGENLARSGFRTGVRKGIKRAGVAALI